MKIQITKKDQTYTAIDVEKKSPITVRDFPEYLELKTESGSKFLTKKKFDKMAQNDVVVLEKSEEKRTRSSSTKTEAVDPVEKIRSLLNEKDRASFDQLVKKAQENEKAQELKSIDEQIAALLELKKQKEGK